MNEYVAYNSVDKWGEYRPTSKFNFYSGKGEKFLKDSIGCNVWVVIGTRRDARTRYQLAGKFRPKKICSLPRGGHSIIGSGTPFRSQMELTELPWFSRLLREQGNFRFGFNLIRDKTVLKNLRKIATKPTSAPTWDRIPVSGYIKALKSLPDRYREILVFQFQCPRYEISAGQLARFMGYSLFRKANLSYGRAAHLICDALEIAKPPTGNWFSAVSEAYHNGKTWIWTMQTNLAEAIKQLGWSREQRYQTFFANPDEKAAIEEFAEGRVQLVAVNVFERNSKARVACLRHHGFFVRLASLILKRSMVNWDASLSMSIT